MATMDRPAPDATAEQYAAWQLQRKLQDMARELHELAQQISATAADLNRRAHLPGGSYMATANRAISAISNAVPGLGLGQLATYASEADLARTKKED